MLNLLRKFLIPYVFNDKKIYLTIISTLFFTIIYSFCSDDEFQGWVETSLNINKFEKDYLINFFKKYSKNKNKISFKEFLELPIIEKDNKFEIVDEKKSDFKSKENIKSKTILFYIYDLNGTNFLTLKQFLNMPINANIVPKTVFDQKSDIKEISREDSKIIKSYKRQTLDSIRTTFDRLYFSVIIQSNLGLGDVFPASKRTRILLILQTFISYIIIVVPYGSLVSWG